MSEIYLLSRFLHFFFFFQNLYHGSEITSIRVGNDTKRDIFYGGERNLTRNQDMAFEVLVHLAENGNDRFNTEEKLQSVLESPIKDTKLPLGADVTVSRVSVADFDECSSNEHNDCADNSVCYNTEGSYTCSCKDGYHDLSGPDSLPGRVCSGTSKYKPALRKKVLRKKVLRNVMENMEKHKASYLHTLF